VFRKLIKHLLWAGMTFAVMATLVSLQIGFFPDTLPNTLWGNIVWATVVATFSAAIAYVATCWI